jgi:hypothetical protein
MEILTGRTFTQNKKVRNYQCSRLWCQIILLIIISVKKLLYMLKACKISFIVIYKFVIFVYIKSMKILTGRTFTQNKMVRNLSIILSLILNNFFNNNFCQRWFGKLALFWYIDLFLFETLYENIGKDGILLKLKWPTVFICKGDLLGVFFLFFNCLSKKLYIF